MTKKVVASNRRARFDYEIVDTFEAGMVLLGSEVKSLREGKASINEAYASEKHGELWLESMNIPPYTYAREGGHEPTRPRKLLLHKREITRIGEKLREQSLTLVPTKVYFSNGRAKVELALGKGKRTIDKRETKKRRQQEREMDRAMRHRRQ
ncbi:MAG: SsrA-binding protein SmpB [Acidimicrobiia bacterium]|nr:SsrA-binding protein SmpB [Acidimicrobiia bacterium]MBT8193390.1 SsrA-binding protein SmpB [Acidimicrobiia bacterium]MBT8248455.1 SsrA-binding protein SmpB [Acidimicrobiia bacterium]NNF89123.1 SsrA-binding protein SmpB [Acidimicrobiia bacterium]NNJ47255.1 SsrA-binding protein SmpB [Acidimicrobiia bacterium]